jgi:hypothetical protein
LGNSLGKEEKELELAPETIEENWCDTKMGVKQQQKGI